MTDNVLCGVLGGRVTVKNILRRLVPKSMSRKPIAKTETYLKYGLVIIEHEKHLCPRCGSVLNAGPNYQPEYCRKCGQKVSFSGICWKEDKKLGFNLLDRLLGMEEATTYESLKDRMV